MCETPAPHLADLLLLKVVPLLHDLALEGAAVPLIEDPLLAQEQRLLLRLGVLHVFLVLGQALLLLLLGCAVVLVHLLGGTGCGVGVCGEGGGGRG